MGHIPCYTPGSTNVEGLAHREGSTFQTLKRGGFGTRLTGHEAVIPVVCT